MNGNNIKMALLNAIQNDIASSRMNMGMTGDVQFKGKMKFTGDFNGLGLNNKNKKFKKTKKHKKYRLKKNKTKNKNVYYKRKY